MTAEQEDVAGHRLHGPVLVDGTHKGVVRIGHAEDAADAAALEVARAIAAKSTTVIRAAKESLNGIDPVDVKRSYRFEQGFTFELNLAGEGDRARDEFVRKSDD